MPPGAKEPGSGPVSVRPGLKGPDDIPPPCRTGLYGSVMPIPTLGVMGPAGVVPGIDILSGGVGGTGAVSRYVWPAGSTGKLDADDEVVPIVGRTPAVGSATVLRLTTALGAPPLLDAASSEPEPTWIDSELPIAPVGPPAKDAMPVRLPGRMLEIPPAPVTKKPDGTGAPLTLAAEPPLGPLLPNEPAPDELAPGKGVNSTNPLVVGTIVPKLAIASR